MYPNIIIGNMILSSWFVILLTGAVVSIGLTIYLRPPDFMVSRLSLLGIGIMLTAAGLIGSRLLFLILHLPLHQVTLARIFSFRGGFAYFGALAFSISALSIYAKAADRSFLALMDYIAPFLFLSQAFVRIGCLMAGCCYGMPTNSHFGVVFKLVDNELRHPTQAYEATLLFAIFIIMIAVYKKKSANSGFVFFLSLFLYSSGRFFIEFLRIDSAPFFMNITLAQAFCIFLATGSVMALLYLPKRGQIAANFNR